MKRFFRPETAFLLAIWLILLVGFRERGFYDPGALWHIKVGEIILDRGFPHTDPFTYTFEGQTWIPQQWGAEVLMALGHRAGGLDTLLLGFAALVAGLFTLIFRRATQSGMGPLLAALIVGGSLFIGAFHYFVRPHMFTIALLGWTMMCIVDFERGRCSVWRIAGLIPLYIVWTNLHGGVLGGTMTLGLAVAGWGVLFLLSSPPPLWGRSPRASRLPMHVAGGGADGEIPATLPNTPHPPSHRMSDETATSPTRGEVGVDDVSPGAQTAIWPRSPIQSWRTAWLLAGIVIACLLTPFVNPFGMEMINTWQRIVGSPVLKKVVNEHMPLDPSTQLGQTVIGFGVFYLVMLAGVFPKLPRVSWLVPLVWLFLGFQSIRQGPLFAITAAVAIVDLWPHTVWHRLLVKYGDGSLARSPDDSPRWSWGWAAVPALAIAFAFTLQVNRTPVPVIGSGWARLDPDFIPVELNAEMQRYAASMPPGTRVFNDANLGGYLIYHTPSLKIFMDDRCELYGDATIAYYSETMGLRPAELGPRFEDWATRLKFERALVMIDPKGEAKPPLEEYLSGQPGRWREVARAKRAAIYERVK